MQELVITNHGAMYDVAADQGTKGFLLSAYKLIIRNQQMVDAIFDMAIDYHYLKHDCFPPGPFVAYQS